MQWPRALMLAALLGNVIPCAASAQDTAPSASNTAPAQCVMQRYADLPLDTQLDGRVSVPVLVEDTPRNFLVDTGAVASTIAVSVANALQMKQHPILLGGLQLFGGRVLNRFVTARHLQLDRLPAENFPLVVMPTDGAPTERDGLLGADILSAYDVEIDFAAQRFRLFTAGSCPANPVYWSRSAPYARVPITVTDQHHIIVPVLLDGQAVNAIADTGAEESSMSLELAKSLFKLEDNDPRLKLRGMLSINGNPPAPIYSFPFATLTFEGIQVNTPDIVLLPKSNIGISAPNLLMGASVLRQLHLYISYKTNTLYLTGAEAK